MLIIGKFPKSIAGRTKRPRGPRVWNPLFWFFLRFAYLHVIDVV